MAPAAETPARTTSSSVTATAAAAGPPPPPPPPPPSASIAHPDSDTQGSQKRRKTNDHGDGDRHRNKAASHQACAACKSRKVRCDASRPQCAYCAARSLACVYPPVYKRALCSQAHVTALESRLAELETRSCIASSFDAAPTAVQRDPTSPLPTSSSSHPRPAPDPRPLQDELVQNEQQHVFTPRASVSYEEPTVATTYAAHAVAVEEPATHDPLPGSHDESEREDLPIMDGMVEYPDAAADTREGDLFYGDSSTLHFAMNVKASTMDDEGRRGARNRRLSRRDDRRGAGGSLTASPSATAPRPGATPHQLYENVPLTNRSFQYLPQRHVAHALVDRYFTAVHPIWPFLVEEATRRRFQDTWMSDVPASHLWTAQLNLIFALGFEFWDDDGLSRLPSRTSMDVGNEFYLRARNFVLGNAFNLSNISMVQSLLLMVQYQQGTMQSEQCWLTIGHATRMAQGLGLHKPHRGDTAIEPVEAELRNRLWWGCFCLDRVSSMIYGRPTGIHHSHQGKRRYHFPKAIDDAFIHARQEQPQDVPSLYAFFHHVAKLYCVVDEVLDLLYEVNRGAEPHPECADGGSDTHQDEYRKHKEPSFPSAIMDIDNHLLRWHDSLPGFLKFSIEDNPTSDGIQDVAIQRQGNILRYRFLGIRILLHRQTLLYLLQPPEKRRWLQDTHPQAPWSAPKQDSADKSALNSPFEASFVQISARICVSSAERLIEAVSAGRPRNLAGAWWWDFYFTFNSLCVIFGAMSLPRPDLTTIIPDTARTTSLVERGFEIIHAMAVVGGPKATQSEKFLKKLMAATIRGAKKRSQEGSNPPRPHVPDPRDLNLPPVSYHLPSPSASLPPETLCHESSAQNPMNNNYMRDSTDQVMGSADWLLDLGNFQSLWEATVMDYVNGSSPDSNSVAIEDMFQSSFDLWDTLDGAPGLV